MLDHFSYHIRHATEAVRPFLELPEEVRDDTEIVRNHRRILRWGAITGIANSTAWAIVLLIGLLGRGWQERDWTDIEVLIVAPLIPIALFLPGTFIGVCFALALVLAWFLDGPAGQRWVRLIGTRNRRLGRVICVIGGIGTSPMLLFPLVAIVGMLFLR